MSYRAPLVDFQFLMEKVAGFPHVQATDRFAEATADVSSAILVEAGKLSEGTLAPLNREGDLQPAVLENGVVRTSPGFAAAYGQIAEGGWTSINASPEHGGMGLPLTLTTAVNEMFSGACLSLQIQVAHRLVNIVGNPNGCEFAGAQQTCQPNRVALVGFYAIP